jgi:hypothetical protein
VSEFHHYDQYLEQELPKQIRKVLEEASIQLEEDKLGQVTKALLHSQLRLLDIWKCTRIKALQPGDPVDNNISGSSESVDLLSQTEYGSSGMDFLDFLEPPQWAGFDLSSYQELSGIGQWDLDIPVGLDNT